MKKSYLLALFLFFIIIWVKPARAETFQQYGSRGQQGIILAWRGSWDIGVGSFEGGIGYKRWLSENWAVKSFLAFGKTDTTIMYGEDGYYPLGHRQREKSFSLLTGAEDHFWNKGRLSFFLGGGIWFKTSSSRIDYIYDDHPPDEIKEVKSNKNIWGIQSTLGVEYFLSKRLSLSGQYQIDFFLEKESRKNIFQDESGGAKLYKQKMTTWYLDTSTSLLILTIYL